MEGEIGRDAAHLLGGLLVIALGLVAFFPQDMPKAKRRNFWAP